MKKLRKGGTSTSVAISQTSGDAYHFVKTKRGTTDFREKTSGLTTKSQEHHWPQWQTWGPVWMIFNEWENNVRKIFIIGKQDTYREPRGIV